MNSVLSKVTYNESYNTHQKSEYGFLSKYVLFNVVMKCVLAKSMVLSNEFSMIIFWRLTQDEI